MKKFILLLCVLCLPLVSNAQQTLLNNNVNNIITEYGQPDEIEGNLLFYIVEKGHVVFNIQNNIVASFTLMEKGSRRLYQKHLNDFKRVHGPPTNSGYQDDTIFNFWKGSETYIMLSYGMDSRLITMTLGLVEYEV